MSDSRRRFLQQIAVGGTSGLAAIKAGEPSEGRTVTYKIDGFTCVTCALGLEVLLKRQKGVIRSKASYPEREAVITFDPGLTNEEAIQMAIQEAGFTVKAGSGN